MEIFLLILFLIIIIEFILFILVLSEIELDISNSDLSYVEKSLNKLNFKKINLAIKISFLGKFLIFACFIDENNINFWKLKFKHRFSGKLEGDILKGIEKIKRLTDKYEKNCINYLKPKIDNFDIYAAIGMPEHMMTVTVLPVLSTYLSFKFRDYIKRKRPMGDYNRQFLSFEKRKDLHPSKLARIKPPKSIPASIYFKDLIDLAENDLEHARELMKYAVERKKQLDAEKEAKENEKNS